MRISDWSSYECSSDLFCIGLFRTFETDWLFAGLLLAVYVLGRQRFPAYALLAVLAAAVGMVLVRGQAGDGGAEAAFGALAPAVPIFDWRAGGRSGERPVGKGRVSTCRFRWSS